MAFKANVGDKFNFWTVISEAEKVRYGKSTLSAVNVKCVCGTEKCVLSQTLRDGSSKSCGCLGRTIPRIGATFGSLEVKWVAYLPEQSAWYLTLLCVCGSTCMRKMSDVLKKKDPLRSCGCKGRVATATHIRCVSCQTDLPTSEFSRREGSSTGYKNRCRDCVRAATLLRRFNISIDQFMALLRFQGGVCALCFEAETSVKSGRIKNYAVDHDHSCCTERGRSCGSCIRGLLCMSCNTGLGSFEYKPATRKFFGEYLDPSRVVKVQTILSGVVDE